MLRVSAVRGRCRDTISLCTNSVSNETCRALPGQRLASTNGSCARISPKHGVARRTSSWPMRPKPRMPSFISAGRSNSPVPVCCQLPARMDWSNDGRWRINDSTMASACVATSPTLASGTLQTHTPCSRAASTSILSTPTALIVTSRILGNASMTARVIGAY